jgi:hypothetical protein
MALPQLFGLLLVVPALLGAHPAEAQRRIDAVSTSSAEPGDVIELAGEFTATPSTQVVQMFRGDDVIRLRIVDWNVDRIAIEIPDVPPEAYQVRIAIPDRLVASNSVVITVRAPSPGGTPYRPTVRLRRVHPGITSESVAVLYGESFGAPAADVRVQLSNAQGATLLEHTEWSDTRIVVRVPVAGPRGLRPGRFDLTVVRVGVPPAPLSNVRSLIVRRTPPQPWELRGPRRIAAVEPSTTRAGEDVDIIGDLRWGRLVLQPGETIHLGTEESLRDLADVPFSWPFPALDTRPIGTNLTVLQVDSVTSLIRVRLADSIAPGLYRIGILNMEMGMSNISRPLLRVVAP